MTKQTITIEENKTIKSAESAIKILNSIEIFGYILTGIAFIIAFYFFDDYETDMAVVMLLGGIGVLLVVLSVFILRVIINLLITNAETSLLKKAVLENEYDFNIKMLEKNKVQSQMVQRTKRNFKKTI